LFDAVMRVLGNEAPYEESRRPERDSAAQVVGLAGIRGARILLAEDNELNQEVAEGLLIHAGMVVDIVPDGEQALARLRNNAYDLVLMDMQMPIMDGITATRLIRQETRFAALPIIAMTANVMEADRRLCLEAGMN